MKHRFIGSGNQLCQPAFYQVDIEFLNRIVKWANTRLRDGPGRIRKYHVSRNQTCPQSCTSVDRRTKDSSGFMIRTLSVPNEASNHLRVCDTCTMHRCLLSEHVNEPQAYSDPNIPSSVKAIGPKPPIVQFSAAQQINPFSNSKVACLTN